LLDELPFAYAWAESNVLPANIRCASTGFHLRQHFNDLRLCVIVFAQLPFPLLRLKSYFDFGRNVGVRSNVIL
jgi:hypothetical protein